MDAHDEPDLRLRRSRWGFRISSLSRLLRYEFDRAYVDRLVAEDPETEQHFTRYFGDLLTLKLRSRLRSAAQVEDAKQETFVRVLATLKRKGGIASPEALGAFVNSVCSNVLFELYRSGSRITPLDEEYDEPDTRRAGAEATLMAAEEETRVRAALAGLPQKDRDVLRLLFFEERDKDAICRELNVDRNYLRVLLHRAKAHFRDRFVSEGSHQRQ
jgi:RNA polymerase sigma-70 factor (ECF subfamily)